MSTTREAGGNGVKKVTVPNILAMKQRGEKIAALTAYDATFAAVEDAAGLDLILVGDSAGMVIKGEPDTISITLDEMIFLTRNVSRGVHRALLAVDVPFGVIHRGTQATLDGSVRLMKEGRAEAVKIEGAGPALEPIQRLTELGVPVIGHLGLTPQSVHAFGGYGLRGAEEDEAARIRRDALALQEAGVFAIVLEKIPRKLAADISASLRIPTIGIASGPECDGQILVGYDMLGLGPKFRFARRYLEGRELIRNAVASYVKDIREGSFPSESESFEA
ncbi:MAG: 3-methyl-2-oxobutanoate hydroxymethyltransferase [bacterium]